jgi:uncharacterized protein YecT (DUF1311 family)
MRLVLILTIAAMASPVAANAATSGISRSQIEKRYTKEYEQCTSTGDAAQGIQSAMNECANAEYSRQDGRLNQAYVMVMKRQGAAGKTKLRTSQRTWITLRDKKCNKERMSYDGGSIAPLIFMTCMTEQTIGRTIWLENYK